MDRQLLKDLQKAIALKRGVRELIAARMEVSGSTVSRWADGQHETGIGNRQRLAKILKRILAKSEMK